MKKAGLVRDSLTNYLWARQVLDFLAGLKGKKEPTSTILLQRFLTWLSPKICYFDTLQRGVEDVATIEYAVHA